MTRPKHVHSSFYFKSVFIKILIFSTSSNYGPYFYFFILYIRSFRFTKKTYFFFVQMKTNYFHNKLLS